MESALAHPLFTPRLRLEPVTAELALAARAGRAAFQAALGAETPAGWAASNLALVARSAEPGPAAPRRVVAVERASEAVVGDVGFTPTRRRLGDGRSLAGQHCYELGYAIARERRRQGFAVEAGGAVVDWLFGEAGAGTILAGCDRRNLASICTLRKLGFWLDSTPGDAFWWVLYPELRSAQRA